MAHPIQDVLAAEKEAETIIEKTTAKRQAILAKAKQEALALLAEEQKKIDAQQQRRIESARQEIGKKVALIRSEAAEQAQQLGRLAEKKIDRACDLILAELDARMG